MTSYTKDDEDERLAQKLIKDGRQQDGDRHRRNQYSCHINGDQNLFRIQREESREMNAKGSCCSQDGRRNQAGILKLKGRATGNLQHEAG
nr:hypothetical protein CFP56_22229 [Quercus suber]